MDSLESLFKYIVYLMKDVSVHDRFKIIKGYLEDIESLCFKNENDSESLYHELFLTLLNSCIKDAHLFGDDNMDFHRAKAALLVSKNNLSGKSSYQHILQLAKRFIHHGFIGNDGINGFLINLLYSEKQLYLSFDNRLFVQWGHGYLPIKDSFYSLLTSAQIEGLPSLSSSIIIPSVPTTGVDEEKCLLAYYAQQAYLKAV